MSLAPINVEMLECEAKTIQKICQALLTEQPIVLWDFAYYDVNNICGRIATAFNKKQQEEKVSVIVATMDAQTCSYCAKRNGLKIKGKTDGYVLYEGCQHVKEARGGICRCVLKSEEETNSTPEDGGK